MHLVLINGDPEAPDWLADRLSEAGFLLHNATSAEQALILPIARQATAMVVEVRGGEAGGAAIVAPLRAGGLKQPLLILAADSDWRDRVDSLDAGADDYLVKPVRSEELTARLRALIRRSAGVSAARLTCGDFTCDMAGKSIWLSGTLVDLTRNEFRLLRIFLLRGDAILSHAEISRLIYAGGPLPSANAVEVQMGRLRRKIGTERILTVRGVGYRLVPKLGQTGPQPG